MIYRLPCLEDKKIILQYIKDHYEHNEKSISASNMLTSMNYEDWVNKVDQNSKVPDLVWGRSLTYLAINEEGKLVGLLNIRYELSEDMRMKYGDIGYSVCPSERKKGYATQMLKYALSECERLNMKSVILGCYKSNLGSAKTIIKNGGELIREVTDNVEVSSYWTIDVDSQYYEIKLFKKKK